MCSQHTERFDADAMSDGKNGSLKSVHSSNIGVGLYNRVREIKLTLVQSARFYRLLGVIYAL